MSMIEVQSLKEWECHDWLLNVHYAKRIPPISHAFGLFIHGVLKGIVTYGVPSSAPLRSGIAGENNSSIVIELNRLCFVDADKNWPSMLVSKSLKLLPRPSIVVSYADTEMGHIGYVYQATNFIYTGLSAKRTDWKVKGLEHLHGQTIADMAPRDSDRAEWMRAKFGDDFYLEDRPRKHRYIFICANKYDKKRIISELKYQQEAYPKGDSAKYEINHEPITQMGLCL